MMIMQYDSTQVYQPEADTCLMLKAAKSEVRAGERVLEIGAGSGVIAADLARVALITATDINPHAVRSTHEKGVDVIRTDLFSGICGKFDLVIFNPPYLPTMPEERIDDWLEKALDGGPTGRVTIERFIGGLERALAEGGRALLLISSLTDKEQVVNLCSENGFSSSVIAKLPVEGEVLLVLKIVRKSP